MHVSILDSPLVHRLLVNRKEVVATHSPLPAALLNEVLAVRLPSAAGGSLCSLGLRAILGVLPGAESPFLHRGAGREGNGWGRVGWGGDRASVSAHDASRSRFL